MARPFSRRAGRARSRGQSLVEIALVLPLFLLMLMILFDFGRVVYALNTINQDAREGVRRGIVSTSGLTTAGAFIARYAEIRTGALTMAPAVPITGADIFGAPGDCAGLLPPDTVPAPPNDDTCFYPNGVQDATATVVVNIQIQVPLITPFIGYFFPDGGPTLKAHAEQIIQS